MVLSLDRWRGKVAIVTGASCGIGAAIAERLVEEGLQVAGLARRSQRIEELSKKLQDKKGKLFAIKADMTKPEDVIQAFEWVKENLGPVHILINNAGVVKPTELIDGDVEKWKETLDTNVLGLCVATREAVGVMKANNIDGHIVHINSIAGHFVPKIPNFNVYSASKHAVTALAKTLRYELLRMKLKIKITSVSPGFVDTEITQTNNFNFPKEVSAIMKSTYILQSKDVVDSVMYVLSTPPHVEVQELIINASGSPA